MTENHRMRKLLEAYVKGELSREEFEELHAYILQEHRQDELAAFMDEMLQSLSPGQDLQIDKNKLYEQIVGHPQFRKSFPESKKDRHKLSRINWQVLSTAALMLIIPVFFFYKSYLSKLHLVQQRPEVKLAPASMTAVGRGPILRLADGTEVNLDSAANGTLATQGNTQITLKGNQLSYSMLAERSKDLEIPLNSIVTPAGSQYQIILPDKSKVWLNAGSTLTYPVYFTGNERKVEIKGEAYFEISKDDHQPFIVKSVSQSVEVLATSFNVSAYLDDESVKTTLVEGRVRVNSTSSSGKQSATVLNPGQQAIVKPGKESITTRFVHTDEVISWKDGLFVFNNEEVKDVMKKISRWYGVKVSYRDGMEDNLIGGSIPRFAQIKKLMDALQATGVLHYKMEGGDIIIME